MYQVYPPPPHPGGRIKPPPPHPGGRIKPPPPPTLHPSTISMFYIIYEQIDNSYDIKYAPK